MQDYVDETAAAQAVGTELLSDHREERREFPRTLVKAALTGSAAAADMVVEIFIGDTYVGRISNQRTGLVVLDLSDWKFIGRTITPNQRLSFRVADAGATNVARVHFVTLP